MPVAEKICLGVNLGTCEKYGEGEQPYDWAIAAGMYTPELDNSGAEVACGCGESSATLRASTGPGGGEWGHVTCSNRSGVTVTETLTRRNIHR